MSLAKNDRFRIVIEDMSEQGEGIGHCDGYTLFVKDTVIGDEIEGKVIKAKKQYGFGLLLRVITPSPFRTEPLCPSARPCGGCQLQAMTYARQLAFKADKVKNHLIRIGGFSEDTLPMEPIIGMEAPVCWPEAIADTGAAGTSDPAVQNPKARGQAAQDPAAQDPAAGKVGFRYRNKGQFPFGKDKNGRIIYGFYAGRTHSIIEAEDCLIGAPVNRRILELIRAFMEEYRIEPYEETSHSGLVRHALIRTGYRTGEIMVCLVINGRSLPHSEELVRRLMCIEGMKSLSLNVNREKTNVILGREMIYLAGEAYISDRIGPMLYHISPQSFFQVNPVQTEKLYGKALEFAALTGDETVWDLYCGIGTISLFLAQKAKYVYGVEIVPAAIENAKKNARLNGLSNTEFFVGKSEEVLPDWYETHKESGGAIDVIVVDPPRKGCEESLLKTMVQMQPKRIVYVSCDSATLARDLKYLCAQGYALQRVQPVDMFPMGVHVETVVLMSRKVLWMKWRDRSRITTDTTLLQACSHI